MGNYCRYFSTPSHARNQKEGQSTNVTRFDNSIRLNPKRETGGNGGNGGNEMVGNVLIVKNGESMVLGAEETEGDGTESSRDTSPKVVLLPHQHTLFCERKQKVCTAVGRCQELEILKLTGAVKDLQWIWFRTSISTLPIDGFDLSQVTLVPGSENKLDYTLGLEDVGKYIGVLFGKKDSSRAKFTPDSPISRAKGLIGPILPGPPRLLDFEVSGELVVGGYAKADGRYIGGFEGPSEYWWIKVSPDGKRSQITDPKPIPVDNANHGIPRDSNDFANDPRFYQLTPDDVNCTLKSKCRPIRNDKTAGEIFTSKSSSKVLKAGPKQSR